MRALLLAAAVAAAAVSPARAESAKPADVDVVLCLDVSGSMDGLIESAKIKLWDIVNDFARVKPTPNLRVALYSYGYIPHGAASGWVKQEIALTTDLDAIYAKLTAFRTNGGEEYAARVTTAAIGGEKWSPNPNAVKILFVCGNEPANQDPKVSMEAAATVAKQAGVRVNAIYCGNPDDKDSKSWRDYAKLCGGRYATIDQDRAKTQAIATPYDKDLSDLSTKLNSTYVAYGKDGAANMGRQTAQDAEAQKAAPGAAAARGLSKAGGLYKNETWDLVDRRKTDPKFDVKSLKDDELCDEMKKLTPDERVKYVEKKAEERAAIQKQIEETAAKRAKHIDEERKKQPKSEKEKDLDNALRSIIREQAAEKGVEIPESK